MDDAIRSLYTQGMRYIRTIDANLARLSEGLRVIEDVCRFELSNDTLTHATKAIRNELKAASQSFSRLELVNARSTGTDVRANATAPARESLTDLITAQDLFLNPTNIPMRHKLDENNVLDVLLKLNTSYFFLLHFQI